KHVLAITNAAGATSEEILDLARKCQKAVEDNFGIRLVPEVQLIGATL
ncbi:MAG: UDP-N-acetylenolpyruvoylglucosamine reductase, partial [Actinobacteria bacterium]|nr:UDP-N-acetylenolpyruvoylglucosamine reductase [Actinomycetota bacterium]